MNELVYVYTEERLFTGLCLLLLLLILCTYYKVMNVSMRRSDEHVLNTTERERESAQERERERERETMSLAQDTDFLGECDFDS